MWKHSTLRENKPLSETKYIRSKKWNVHIAEKDPISQAINLEPMISREKMLSRLSSLA